MRMPRFAFLVLLLVAPLFAGTVAEAPHGATVETERYRAVFKDGVLTSFVNKLTKEEYLKQDAKMDGILSHLPSGLGTQNTPVERDAAHELLEKGGWMEHDVKLKWPNQHYPDAQSSFTYTSKSSQSAVLAYKGLTNGKDRFGDETFSLEVAIDADTGDLLITPEANSTRGGVYGCGVTLATLAPEVTVEAPIFEGMRLDRKMLPNMWNNFWANFWDYSFVALNGEKTGAVGLWCQDKDMKYYKSLFYLNDADSLTLSVQTMSIPPFEPLKNCKGLAWRMQAFDKSWAQAAARFRNWRLKNIKFTPRPDWVKKLSFMAWGMDKCNPGNAGITERYFDDQNLDRVITYASSVRGAGFDENHTNNNPYPGFREDMKGWKAKNMKVLVYLQPMIMWTPKPKTDREKMGLQFAYEADPLLAFLPDHTHKAADWANNHNLGSPHWQRWFLDWVHEYLHDYGADGIYHDQAYLCPLDVRGLSAPGGMTTPQAMADYFSKAALENPGTMHGCEHMQEVNNISASLGLGCGIHWGTPGYNKEGHINAPGTMCWQRIRKASPVSNSLNYPNGAIFAFPHQSNYSERGSTFFNDGMMQQERRGDLPSLPLVFYPLFVKGTPPDEVAGDLLTDRLRALAFVRHGLHAAFPEDWDRKVLSYFQGAKGEDFRYEELPEGSHGSAFVQYVDGRRLLQYARLSGGKRATVEGAILGWPCYDEHGPMGLNPTEDITYMVEGNLKRPSAWFTLPDDSLYVSEGYLNENLAVFQLKPNGEANGKKELSIILNEEEEPKAVWVNGKLVKAVKAGPGRWTIKATNPSSIAAIFHDIPAGSAPVASNLAVSRCVDPTTKRDMFRPDFLTKRHVVQEGQGVQVTPAKNGIEFPFGQSEVHIPVKASSNGLVLMEGAGKVLINGVESGNEAALKAGAMAIVSIYSSDADRKAAVIWRP